MSVESLLNPGVVGQWSGRIWNGFPIDGIRNGLTQGFLREWDFAGVKQGLVNGADGYWDRGLRAFGPDGGGLVYVAGVGDAVSSSLTGDTDNEATGIRDQVVNARFSRADKMFAFETEIDVSAITDSKFGAFIGLISNTALSTSAPITTSGTLADMNLVGFHRLEGDGDKLDLVYKADGVTQVTLFADAVTLVAGTKIRLGMTYRPEMDPFTESKYVFRWWVNGAPIDGGTSYKVIPSTDGDDFPNDVAMGYVNSIMLATSSTPGTQGLYRTRYGQVY